MYEQTLIAIVVTLPIGIVLGCVVALLMAGDQYRNGWEHGKALGESRALADQYAYDPVREKYESECI